MADTLRVLLIDDHPIVPLGLSIAIETVEGWEVCGQAADPSSAIEATARLKPDVIIMDLSMGGRDGPALVGDLIALHPPVRILVYTALPEATYARRVFQAGGYGYLSKSKGVQQLPDALAALMKGNRYASSELQQIFFQEHASGSNLSAKDPLKILSERELQVLRLLGNGSSLGDIARELNLSVKTVGTHRERIKLKLGVEDARELFRRADEFIRSGLI